MEKKVYEVWHLADDGDRPVRDGGNTAHFPDDYKLVARVEAHNANEVYWMTHHRDGDPWWEVPGVECVRESNRSTTINDVVVDSDGEISFCGRQGWLQVSQQVGHSSEPEMER